MQNYNVSQLVAAINGIKELEVLLEKLSDQSNLRDVFVREPFISQIIKERLLFCRQQCEVIGLQSPLDRLNGRLHEPLNVGALTHEALEAQLCELRGDINRDLALRQFAFIPEAKARVGDQLIGAWEPAWIAFPKCKQDSCEAVDCFLFGLNTACVFHLMRVAEVGMRSLAFDRRITGIKSRPLELAEWGHIIGELEKRVQTIQQWKAGLAREAAHEFYNSSLVDLRGFNDGWRRHVSHMRGQGYQDDETAALVGHVQRFMKKLSTKISESKRTPVVWRKP